MVWFAEKQRQINVNTCRHRHLCIVLLALYVCVYLYVDIYIYFHAFEDGRCVRFSCGVPDTERLRLRPKASSHSTRGPVTDNAEISGSQECDRAK